MKSSFVFAILVIGCAAADVTKIEAVIGSVKFIETNSNQGAYIVTTLENNTDNFYLLDADNNVITTTTFKNVVSVLSNSQDQLYLFDFDRSNNSIQIWIFYPEKSSVVSKFDFIPSYYQSFFIADDNVFFNAFDGVYVLRRSDGEVVKISGLEFYRICNNDTYAIDVDGNVHIGVAAGSDLRANVVVIDKNDVFNPAPLANFLNFSEYDMVDMVSFQDSIYLGTRTKLIQYLDGNFTTIFTSDAYPDGSRPSQFTVVNDRLYFQYLYDQRIGIGMYEDVSVQFIDRDYERHRIENYQDNLGYFFQSVDKDGNIYFGDSGRLTDFTAHAYFLKSNETDSTRFEMPKDLHIRGLAATENGDLWIVDYYSVHLIARDSLESVKVADIPYVSYLKPIKAKRNTDEVLIGIDDGLYSAMSKRIY